MGIFDNDINLKEEYKADDINSLIEIVKKYHDITFVGNGSELHKDLILKNIEDAKFEEDNSQTGYSCGLIGFKKYNIGQLVTPDSLLPNYLRKSQAEKKRLEE